MIILEGSFVRVPCEECAETYSFELPQDLNKEEAEEYAYENAEQFCGWYSCYCPDCKVDVLEQESGERDGDHDRDMGEAA